MPFTNKNLNSSQMKQRNVMPDLVDLIEPGDNNVICSHLLILLLGGKRRLDVLYARHHEDRGLKARLAGP